MQSEELKKMNKELETIRSNIAKYQEDSLIKIEEVNIGLLAEMSKFKSNLLVDLDYKQKNNDSKLAYFEEQIYQLKKFVSSAPTMLEIETKIVDACAEMRNKVKLEVKESMLMPEIRGLAYDIRESSQ